MDMNDKQRKAIGAVLLIVGSVISLFGAQANNMWLDHNLALRVWSISNVVLLAWSVGLWRRWWDGGLPAVAMCILYSYYTVTNFWALQYI